jgi:hypothetical protein
VIRKWLSSLYSTAELTRRERSYEASGDRRRVYASISWTCASPRPVSSGRVPGQLLGAADASHLHVSLQRCCRGAPSVERQGSVIPWRNRRERHPKCFGSASLGDRDVPTALASLLTRFLPTPLSRVLGDACLALHRCAHHLPCDASPSRAPSFFPTVHKKH